MNWDISGYHLLFAEILFPQDEFDSLIEHFSESKRPIVSIWNSVRWASGPDPLNIAQFLHPPDEPDDFEDEYEDDGYY